MNDSRRVVCLLGHSYFSSQQMLCLKIIIRPSLGTPVTLVLWGFSSFLFILVFNESLIIWQECALILWPGLQLHEKNKWKLPNFKHMHQIRSPSILNCTWRGHHSCLPRGRYIPATACGYHIGECKCTTFPSLEKVALNTAAAEHGFFMVKQSWIPAST